LKAKSDEEQKIFSRKGAKSRSLGELDNPRPQAEEFQSSSKGNFIPSELGAFAGENPIMTKPTDKGGFG
jgi:hypothetical protein